MSRRKCPCCGALTLTVRIGVAGLYVWCRNACDRATIVAALNPDHRGRGAIANDTRNHTPAKSVSAPRAL